MERNIDRKTLSFSKGMTNVPSDLLSDDTELAESNGFIYRDGEMKPVQGAKSVTSIPFKLRYVHKSADYKNLIAYNENEKELKCYNFKGEGFGKFDIQTFSMEDVMDVNSVGNTLVIATSEGLHYLLFKGSKYIDLGTELPKPDFGFYFSPVDDPFDKNTEYSSANLSDFIKGYDEETYSWYDSDGNYLGIAPSMESTGTLSSRRYYRYYIYRGDAGKEEPDKFTDFQNAVQGHVASMINWVKSKNYFAFPFFIRVALRLYDGTYTRITNPIICYPSIDKNDKVGPTISSTEIKQNKGEEYASFSDGFRLSLDNIFYFIRYSKLYFKFGFGEDVSNWTDIIKDVVVFCSDQVLPFYLYKDWAFQGGTEAHNTICSNSYFKDGYEEKKKFFSKDYPARQYIVPQEKTKEQIRKELVSKSQFYKLFSVDVKSNIINAGFFCANDLHDGLPIIEDNVCSTLTEQEMLKVDDYYGWCDIVTNKLFPYNNRLNIVGPKRFPWKGFSYFAAEYIWDIGDSWSFYVHIKSKDIDDWVKSDQIHSASKVVCGWFYYPDTNACEVMAYNSTTRKGVLRTLTKHPYLNGAYSFFDMPSKAAKEFNEVTLPTVGNTYENLNSQIFTSVVNNPFVFEASGDNTVGTGKILGIVANTEAVSQGQFGQYPLLVFTDEGIYAMGVNSEGLYSNVYPISREVCNNADSITPTDNLVFFTSDKGLMAISGGNAACLSEQMRGRVPRNFATMGGGRFLEFLKDCFIAYDYRDSLLRIYKKSKGVDENGDMIDEEDSYYYIYNMVDKTFSMGKLVEKNQHGEFPFGIQAVANDYPDNLTQDVYGNIYSQTDKPDINDDETSYSGGFTTRPLKLGGSMTLKSIRAIKHLYDTDEGKVKLEVYGSNDCKNWVKLDSLGGKPWKYFTFKYTLTDFKACDSFAGSIVEIQGRREDKIR